MKLEITNLRHCDSLSVRGVASSHDSGFLLKDRLLCPALTGLLCTTALAAPRAQAVEDKFGKKLHQILQRFPPSTWFVRSLFQAVQRFAEVEPASGSASKPQASLRAVISSSVASQVKRTEKIKIWEALSQAETEASAYDVLSSRSGATADWYAALPLRGTEMLNLQGVCIS